uniref:V2 protein n=1 Tax=Grapevine red blotch virus TaxID=1381007 RepID=A0A5C1DCE6_9GEMI|nr:V2 protein [Grapevine red blotch virus]
MVTLNKRNRVLPECDSCSSSESSLNDIDICGDDDGLGDEALDAGSVYSSSQKLLFSVAKDVLLDDCDSTILDISLPSALWFLSQRYLTCCLRKELLPLPGISEKQTVLLRQLIRRVARRHCLFTYKCEEWFEGCLKIKEDGNEKKEPPTEAEKKAQDDWEEFSRKAACSAS